MADADPKAAGADDSAPEAEKTEEQLWNEIESEDKPSDSDADEPEGDDEPPAEDAAADSEGEGTDEPPADDAGTETSEAGEDDEPAAAPDGTDPEALRAQNERLQQAFRSEQGRAKALQRKIQTLESQIAAAEKSPQGDRDEATLEERKKKLEAVEAEYGEVVGPLVEQIKELESRVETLSAREQQDLEQRKAEYDELVREEQSVFETEHPDGFDVIAKNAEAFNRWIEDQPKHLRDIFSQNQQVIVDGSGAALLVGKFKEALLSADGGPAPASEEQKRLQSRREKQLAGARSERTQTSQAASSRPAKDSDDAKAHWDYFERIDKA